MVHQSCSYLKLKGRTYYFSRRVPKRIQKHFKTDRVEVCLHTTLESSARRQSQVLANELEDHWYILRRREMKDRLSNVFGGFEFGQGAGPVLDGLRSPSAPWGWVFSDEKTMFRVGPPPKTGPVYRPDRRLSAAIGAHRSYSNAVV